MLGHALCAFQPGCVPEIEQHLRSSGEAVRREFRRLLGARLLEATSFVERLDVLDQVVRELFRYAM